MRFVREFLRRFWEKAVQSFRTDGPPLRKFRLFALEIEQKTHGTAFRVIESLGRSFRRLRRRVRQRLLHFALGASVRRRRLQVRLQVRTLKVRHLRLDLLLFVLVVGIGGWLVYGHRAQWGLHFETLAVQGTLQQLEIAVGAAMLGVIGIVFSLSVFSIQQVAERGTPLTLREYARDGVFRLVYGSLAAFGFLAVLSALLKNEYALYRICVNLGIFAASVLLLKVYFDRAISFVDPHFTISKVAKRASKQLRQIRSIEGAVQAEVRYGRSRRPR